MTDPLPTRRRSRFWLYGPFMLLVVLAAGWSAFWFYARGRIATEIDTALAREVERGRTWTCTDRSIGGFPFRIELRCNALSLTSTRWGDQSFSLRRLLITAASATNTTSSRRAPKSSPILAV